MVLVTRSIEKQVTGWICFIIGDGCGWGGIFGNAVSQVMFASTLPVLYL